jgi:hypothetical protein
VKLRSFLLMTLMVFVLGCGGKVNNGKREPVFPSKGTVVYKGQPVVGADVTFTLEGGNRSAFGRTDSKGAFRLTTHSPNDGAVAGKHTIMVTKAASSAASKTAAPVESKEYVPPGIDDAPPASSNNGPDLPAKYGSAATTTLFGVVDKGAPNNFDLELTD